MTAIDPATGQWASGYFGAIPYRGYNVDFIAQYLYENPGARSGMIRDALAQSRGVDKSPPGWGTCYFTDKTRNRFYRNSTTWAGKLWRRIDQGNARKGWVLTLEGMGRVKNP